MWCASKDVASKEYRRRCGVRVKMWPLKNIGVDVVCPLFRMWVCGSLAGLWGGSGSILSMSTSPSGNVFYYYYLKGQCSILPFLFRRVGYTVTV
jgi:hypothetical protein